MRRCLVVVVLGVAMPAHADRKEAGPDVPALADVATIEVSELVSETPKCERLTWSVVIDVAHRTWIRSPEHCRAQPAPVAVAHGAIAIADLEPLYKRLDEQAPRICDSKYPKIVVDIVTNKGNTVELVELACEHLLRLHELAAFVRALPPAR